MDRLRSLILTHWQHYQPTMFAQFQKENRLEAELKATQEQIIDLMYELEVVKKMDRSAAWEIVQEQFFQPEEEESSSMNQSRKDNPPATSK